MESLLRVVLVAGIWCCPFRCGMESAQAGAHDGAKPTICNCCSTTTPVTPSVPSFPAEHDCCDGCICHGVITQSASDVETIADFAISHGSVTADGLLAASHSMLPPRDRRSWDKPPLNGRMSCVWFGVLLL